MKTKRKASSGQPSAKGASAHGVRAQHVIIYAKRPKPGHTKTRLGKSIGMTQAAGVYARILYTLLLNLLQTHLNRISIELAVASADDVAFFTDAFPECIVRPQVAGSLGERMAASFKHAFESGAKTVVLVGSDIPGLDSSTIHSAFEILKAARAVVGPSDDGGYYLIGMRAPGANLFQDIPWSTDVVLKNTEALARSQGLTMVHLPTLSDMDTVIEYQVWRENLLLKTQDTSE